MVFLKYYIDQFNEMIKIVLKKNVKLKLEEEKKDPGKTNVNINAGEGYSLYFETDEKDANIIEEMKGCIEKEISPQRLRVKVILNSIGCRIVKRVIGNFNCHSYSLHQ